MLKTKTKNKKTTLLVIYSYLQWKVCVEKLLIVYVLKGSLELLFLLQVEDFVPICMLRSEYWHFFFVLNWRVVAQDSERDVMDIEDHEARTKTYILADGSDEASVLNTRITIH